MQIHRWEVEVLLIDDDEDDRVLIRDMLADIVHPRFKVHWASDYESGLEELHRGRHDVCLLDYQLGERTGLGLLREATQNGCTTPIILLTGREDYTTDIEAMQAGAVDYLIKDHVNSTLLERSIRYALDRKHKERELREYQGRLEVLVAERTRAQQALRESEEQLRLVIDAVPALISYVDSNQCFRFNNKAYEEWLLHSRSEVFGKHIRDALGEKAYRAITEHVEAALSGMEVTYEDKLFYKDADVRHIRATYVPHFGEGKEVKGFVALATDITAWKETERQLRDLSARLLTAQEEERKRIAHELHDSIGASLSAIKFRIESGYAQVQDGKISSAFLQSVTSLVQQTIEEARRLMSDLHPSMIEDLGILPTINWFTRQFQDVYSHISVEKVIGIEENDVPEPLKIVIFRIMQEALHNVAKYSKADMVRLVLTQEGGAITFAIRDNGTGFDIDAVRSRYNPGRGFGLSTMRERAELSGGSFAIESAVGSGTTVRVLWPGPRIKDRP